MQELPKAKAGKEPERGQTSESGDDPCWAEEFDYYYDDAHGYEPYDPEANDDDDEPDAAGEERLTGRK